MMKHKIQKWFGQISDQPIMFNINREIKAEQISISDALIQYGSLQSEIQSVAILAYYPEKVKLIQYIDDPVLKLIADKITNMHKEINRLNDEITKLKVKEDHQ